MKKNYLDRNPKFKELLLKLGMPRIVGCGEIIETISADIHIRCGDADGAELCYRCSSKTNKEKKNV